MSLSQSAGTSRVWTAHDYVLKTLREAIMDGTLIGGTRMIQTEIASQLKVSVTPVREALRGLATEGLVVFDSHRGALVRSLDLVEVRELYELRTLLEPLMVHRAIAKISPEQLARAEERRRQMEETQVLSEWVELHRQFHAALYQADDSSRLSKVLSGLRDSASVYVSLSLRAKPERILESSVEHEELIRLYTEHDAQSAVDLTVQHLGATLATIEQAHERGLL
jgi:DNA-binding GntR family transcriptional regulator